MKSSRNTEKDVVPNIDEDGDFLGYKCPNCGDDRAIEYDGIYYFPYCGICGQKIRWENVLCGNSKRRWCKWNNLLCLM